MLLLAMVLSCLKYREEEQALCSIYQFLPI